MTPTTASSVMRDFRRSPDFQRQVHEHCARKAEELERSAGSITREAADALTSLTVEWPSVFDERVFPGHLALVSTFQDALARGDDQVKAWAQQGPAASVQAAALTKTIASRFGHPGEEGVEQAMRQLEHLKADPALYAAASRSLGSRLAELRAQWRRVEPLTASNVQKYLHLIVGRQQAVLDDVVARADSACATREECIRKIERAHQDLEMRYGLRLEGVTVDRERYRIVPAKEEAHA